MGKNDRKKCSKNGRFFFWKISANHRFRFNGTTLTWTVNLENVPRKVSSSKCILSIATQLNESSIIVSRFVIDEMRASDVHTANNARPITKTPLLPCSDTMFNKLCCVHTAWVSVHVQPNVLYTRDKICYLRKSFTKLIVQWLIFIWGDLWLLRCLISLCEVVPNQTWDEQKKHGAKKINRNGRYVSLAGKKLFIFLLSRE